MKILLSVLLTFLSVQKAFSVGPYQQCGGDGYSGATNCDSGYYCAKVNQWYCQCQNDGTVPQTGDKGRCDGSSAFVEAYKQCGGEGYSGNKQCAPGFYCAKVNQYYCQCQNDGTVPNTGDNGRCDGSSNVVPTSQPLTQQPSTGCDMPYKGFFHWGGSDDLWVGKDKTELESAWLGYNGALPDQGLLDRCSKNNKIPYLYGYVIAFEARKIAGLQDCNVDPAHNLCIQGANFIRNNRQHLIDTYARDAKFVGDHFPKDKPVVWHLEPDFHQYCGDNSQQGGPLGDDFCRKFYIEIVQAIKRGNPCSKIVWDVSPWVPIEQWWGVFKNIPEIDFVGTSGGCAQAGAEIKDGLTWSRLNRVTGKKIFADCGYGVGGQAEGNCGQWSGANLRARIADGVIGVMAGKGANNVQPSWEKIPITGA